jgi:hypothetical protein
MTCVNSMGAAKLLDVAPVTIWRWCISRRLHGFAYGIHTLIPLREIAKEANTTQKNLTKEADRLGITLWRCKGK